jgi:hypothetical protein
MLEFRSQITQSDWFIEFYRKLIVVLIDVYINFALRP